MKTPWYASVLVVALVSGCASASQVAGTQPTVSLAAPTAVASANLVATGPMPPPRTAPPRSPGSPVSVAAGSVAPPPPTQGAPSGPPTQLGPPGGDQPGPNGELYSQHAAQLRADTLVALVQVPPGAVRHDGALPAALTAMGEGIGAETAKQDRWWTVSGSPATVSAFVLAHPPTGLVAGGSSGDIHGEMTYDYNYPQGAKAPQTLLGISVAPDGDHVDVRAQAQVAYLPTRTAVETIPASVTSAEAVYQPPNQMLPANTTPAPRRNITLTGADLRLITTAFNALDAQSPVVHSCPAPNGEEAFVTAAYGGHRVVFHIELNGCGGIEVTSDGVPQPELGLSEGVYSAVHTALHVTKAENPTLP